MNLNRTFWRHLLSCQRTAPLGGYLRPSKNHFCNPFGCEVPPAFSPHSRTAGQSAIGSCRPLTTGFGARGAAKDTKALQVDLTQGQRRRASRQRGELEILEELRGGTSQRCQPHERLREENWSTAVRRSATAKRPPRGHEGWMSRRHQPQGLP